jgi:two-component system OmpR family sensor kinase
MNDLEKRSFYSFLSLYIISSFLFLSLIGYLYYSAQKDALSNETYYKLEHFTDKVSGEIIMAHMNGKALNKISVPDTIQMALINTKGMVEQGKLVETSIQKKAGYFSVNGYEIYISDGPREHLGIAYVVAQTDTLVKEIQILKNSVLQSLVIASFLIVLIAVILSKIFMNPVRQRVEQIERFINDVTHELNTPITSLSMATNQALKQGECSEKTMKNISISTKQLYDIYSSLTYLNFSSQKDIAEPINLKETLNNSVEYYRPLAEIKRIMFDVQLEDTVFSIPEAQATLLFGNLIGNAIKYSSPKSTITITLKDKILSIKDEGIGIEDSKQKEIFEKFKRGTEYSGGFGVGLSIVKSICDEYGIEIDLESAVDKGTKFKLMFS